MLDLPFSFSFDSERLRIVTAAYFDGCLAVRVIDADGAPYATLSTHVEGRCLGTEAFFLKDWSENAVLAAHLTEMGLFEALDDIPIAVLGHVWAEARRLVAPALV